MLEKQLLTIILNFFLIILIKKCYICFVISSFDHFWPDEDQKLGRGDLFLSREDDQID